MGSDVEVLAWGIEPDEAVRWAFREVERLEACWSRFRPTSELSALNRSAGTASFPCSPTLWAALSRAAHGWRATGGLYDPTVLGALIALGYDRSFADVAPRGDLEPTIQRVPGFDCVLLDDERQAVALPRDVAIDLGGIGKGLAADLLVAGLRERGVTSGEVSLGGDLRVFGPGPDDDDAWLIEVQHPSDDAVRAPIAA